MSGRIRVLLADDHPIVRSGLEAIIESTQDMIVCAKTSDTNETIQAITRNRPDVLVLDLGLEGGGGIEVLKRLGSELPPTLVLTVQPETTYGLRCMRAGARGFLNKNVPQDTILLAIRTLSNGRTFVSSDIQEALLRTGKKTSLLGVLSKREMEVLRLLIQGMQNKTIGNALGISDKTVSTHKQNLMEKLNADNLAALLQIAKGEGLVDKY